MITALRQTLLSRMARAANLLGATAFVMACASEQGVPISAAELGTDWPFSVAEGRLECRGASEVVFTANGVTYAINGMATGTKKYSAVEAIWLDNPAIPGAKKTIGPIIARGLKLCK